MANRAETIKLLEALPEPSQKLLNRREAKQPTTPGVGETTLANRRQMQDEAVTKVMNETGCNTRAAAYHVAASRNPELFA
jgi:hypothetical protein